VFPHPRFARRSLCWLLPLIGVAACTRADNSAVRAPGDSAGVVTGASQTTSAPITPADTDDFGAALPVDARDAARVVSLNPAATEVIYALGAAGRLVGRSKWDEYPAAVTQVKALGDGIRPNVEAVLAEHPTLVVLYATPDNRPAAAAFARAGVRTIALRVDRIAQFHGMVRALGRALGADGEAQIVSDTVQATLDRVRALTARHTTSATRPRVVWTAWDSPPMVIGGGSYMDELLTIAGADNVFHDMQQPSPQVSMEEIVRRAPQFVVTSQSRARTLAGSSGWRDIPAVREGRIVAEDVTLTGRPSVVLGMAAVHLARLLHPALADSLR
jgi:ABC-type Fe3+-hydroxamate transport system substrate-binding protein